jgi:hypothetical protein
MNATKLFRTCRVAHHEFEVWLLRWLRGDPPNLVLGHMNDALMQWTQAACMLQPLSANVESALIRALAALRDMQSGQVRTDRLAKQWAARLNVWIGQLLRALPEGVLPEPPELLEDLAESLTDPQFQYQKKSKKKRLLNQSEKDMEHYPSQAEIHFSKSAALMTFYVHDRSSENNEIELTLNSEEGQVNSLMLIENNPEKIESIQIKKEKTLPIKFILKSRPNKNKGGRYLKINHLNKSAQRISKRRKNADVSTKLNSELSAIQRIFDKPRLTSLQITAEFNEILNQYLPSWHWEFDSQLVWPTHSVTRLLIVKEVTKQVLARAVACTLALGRTLPTGIHVQGGVAKQTAVQWGETDCWLRIDLAVSEPNWDAVVQWADARRASALTVLEASSLKSQALSWLGTASGFAAAFGLGDSLVLPSLRQARSQLKLLGGRLESTVLSKPWALSWTVHWAADTLPSPMPHVTVPKEARIWLVADKRLALEYEMVWGVVCPPTSDAPKQFPDWVSSLRMGLALNGWRDVLMVPPDRGLSGLDGLVGLAWMDDRWLPVFNHPPSLMDLSETLSFFTTL